MQRIWYVQVDGSEPISFKETINRVSWMYSHFIDTFEPFTIYLHALSDEAEQIIESICPPGSTYAATDDLNIYPKPIIKQLPQNGSALCVVHAPVIEDILNTNPDWKLKLPLSHGEIARFTFNPKSNIPVIEKLCCSMNLLQLH